MSDGAAISLSLGGYVVSCFVAAAIAQEFFGATNNDTPDVVLAGLCWPLIIIGAVVRLLWLALWRAVHTYVHVVAQYRRRRLAALNEVEQWLNTQCAATTGATPVVPAEPNQGET